MLHFDSTKINGYISKLTNNKLTNNTKFYTKDKTSAYNDSEHFVYAWRSGNVVKIGRTASYFEALVFSSMDLSKPKGFDEIRTALMMGISCSRIYQVARRLNEPLKDVVVIGVDGPFETQKLADDYESKLRDKFTSIPKQDMLDKYYSDPAKHDGCTEFVEYDENKMGCFSQLKDMAALSDSVSNIALKD